MIFIVAVMLIAFLESSTVLVDVGLLAELDV